MRKAVGFLLAAKVQSVNLPTVTPLVERRRRLVVLETFQYCTVYHHLHTCDQNIITVPNIEKCDINKMIIRKMSFGDKSEENDLKFQQTLTIMVVIY